MVASMMTFPMCIMKASMKLNMPKTPKLGKKSSKTWEQGKDKFEKHKDEIEGHLEDAESVMLVAATTEEHPEEEMEAVGEATSLALAFLGATTPSGVVAFLWAFFCLIADKAGIEALSKFAESDDTTLIVFLVGLLWDGICGQFGTMIMTIVTQLIFCNTDFCYGSCDIEHFNFRTPKTEPPQLTAADETSMQNMQDESISATFEFSPNSETCSVLRKTTQKDEHGWWWREGFCDNPQCDLVRSTSGLEINPSVFARTYESPRYSIGSSSSPCADTNPNCVSHMNNGGCGGSSKHTYRTWCRKTCGYCNDRRYGPTLGSCSSVNKLQITTAAECEAAAVALNIPVRHMSGYSRTNIPGGCVMTLSGNAIDFNENLASTTAHNDRKLICESDADTDGSSGVYGNTIPGQLPGHALSALDGYQAWSGRFPNSKDAMIIDAGEKVSVTGVITQARFCPGEIFFLPYCIVSVWFYFFY